MPIGKVWIYCLLFICLFVCVCVCTVTDFSAEDKPTGVTFCTSVHRRPRQGIFHFGEHCFSRFSPEAQNYINDELALGSHGGGRRAHEPRKGSACMDTDLLVQILSVYYLVVNSWTRLSGCEDGEAISDEARLINTLMDRYKKMGKVARPLANSSMPIKVGLSVMLYQLVNVDEHEQFITLKLWMHMVYRHLSFIVRYMYREKSVFCAKVSSQVGVQIIRQIR